MCQSCGLNGQRTFGAVVALEPVVPVSELGTDLVECVDTGNRIERRDATEDANGDYWEDSNGLANCGHCDRLFDAGEVSDNDGYCERCRERYYFRCSSCDGVFENCDCSTSNAGDSYCDSCYGDNFYSCSGCSCELSSDEGHACDGELYCDGCYRDNSDEGEREPARFSGRDEYSKIGSRRRFGVELETDVSNGWTNWINRTVWGAKSDGSVNGKEFVSPVLFGDDGLNSVADICDRMESSDFEVNRDCGYHLHIDLTSESDEEMRRIALAYAYTREFWFACVDSTRRSNGYCHSNLYNGRVYWDVDTIKTGRGRPNVSTRYIWANWYAYNSHSTLEIRLHQGTIDGREVCNWIKAHLRFVDYVKGLTVGQITRIFGNKTLAMQMRNMRDLWRDADLSDYYARKAGIGEAVAAA